MNKYLTFLYSWYLIVIECFIAISYLVSFLVFMALSSLFFWLFWFYFMEEDDDAIVLHCAVSIIIFWPFFIKGYFLYNKEYFQALIVFTYLCLLRWCGIIFLIDLSLLSLFSGFFIARFVDSWKRMWNVNNMNKIPWKEFFLKNKPRR